MVTEIGETEVIDCFHEMIWTCQHIIHNYSLPLEIILIQKVYKIQFLCQKIFVSFFKFCINMDEMVDVCYLLGAENNMTGVEALKL